MSSSRAQAVADVLWELKQAEKLGTASRVARRAGFSPGANGKTIINVLESVRREWPHLQWWRIVRDDGKLIHKDQSQHLSDAGIKVSGEKDGASVLVDETIVMVWDEAPGKATETAQA
jgi:hypothetical protein